VKITGGGLTLQTIDEIKRILQHVFSVRLIAWLGGLLLWPPVKFYKK